MKTKKKITYPLLLVVLLIWGAIFYRLFFPSADHQLPIPQSDDVAVLKHKSAPYEREEKTLLGNYADPFMRKEERIADEQVYVEVERAEHVPVEEFYVDWSGIEYVGEISNAATKRNIIIVRIHGKEHMMTVGQTQQELTILRNAPDALLLQYQGNKKVFSKTQENNEANSY